MQGFSLLCKILIMRFFLNLVLATVVFSSCQKNNNVPAQPDKVSINIISPTANHRYKKGDTVQIKADVSYISQLHGYQIRLIDSATGFAVYDIDGHVHGSNVSVDEKWVDTLSVSRTLKIQIMAILDHDQNASVKEVVVYSQP